MLSAGRCAPSITHERRAWIASPASAGALRVGRDPECGRCVCERERELRARRDFCGIGRRREPRRDVDVNRRWCVDRRSAQPDGRGARTAAGARALVARLMRIFGAAMIVTRGAVHRVVRRHCSRGGFDRGMYAVHRTWVPLHGTGNRHRKRGAAYQCRERTPEAMTHTRR